MNAEEGEVTRMPHFVSQSGAFFCLFLFKDLLSFLRGAEKISDFSAQTCLSLFF